MENHKGMMKAFLYENLRDLMVRNVFEKITIKQICDQTGVIRATFYNYFEDKYDCLNAIVYHDLAEDIIKNISTITMQQAVENSLRAIDSNREFYRRAYNVTGQNSFEEMVHRNVILVVKTYLEKYRTPGFLPKFSNDMIAGYYGQCVAYQYKVYVFQKDIPSDPKEYASMIIELMNHTPTDFFSK